MNPDTIYITQARQTSHTYLWWFFLGGLGAHQYYLGRTGLGIAYTLTLGFLGVGVLIDLFAIPGKVRRRNSEIQQQVYGRVVSA